jgi:hypothetical protein
MASINLSHENIEIQHMHTLPAGIDLRACLYVCTAYSAMYEEIKLRYTFNLCDRMSIFYYYCIHS